MTVKRIPIDEEFAAGAPVRTGHAAAKQDGGRRARRRALNAADGTSQLLVSGFWIMVVGCIAGTLAATVFGGVSAQGAHTNAGWLSLMLAMMATPFAILLLLLGGAKWLRNHGLSRGRDEGSQQG